MRYNSPESLLQEVMWQVTGGMIGVPPLLLVGSNRNDYVMSNEDLDVIMSQLLWHSDNDGPPPLAQEIIENLPEITISQEQALSKLQCSVCWELYNLGILITVEFVWKLSIFDLFIVLWHFADEKVRQLKCGHIYHKECISPWLALHATCPICRQSLQPENSESEARNTPPREPFDFGQNIRIGGNARKFLSMYLHTFQTWNFITFVIAFLSAPNIAALLFRACRDPTNARNAQGGPATTASAPANPAPSSSVPFSPAPADAAPNTSATSEFSGFSNTCENPTPMSTETTSTSETPVNQTSTNPTPNQRLSAAIPAGVNHIVLMASPQQGADRSNVSEYSIAFWSNFPPLSSPAVSSTTSEVNSRRSPANFDMDLEWLLHVKNASHRSVRSLSFSIDTF